MRVFIYGIFIAFTNALSENSRISDSASQNLNILDNEEKLIFNHVYPYKSFEKRSNFMSFDEYINKQLNEIQNFLHKINLENHDLSQGNYLTSEDYGLLAVIIATYFNRKYTVIECVNILTRFCQHMNSIPKNDNRLTSLSFACNNPTETCKKTIHFFDEMCRELEEFLEKTSEFTNYVCRKENLVCKYLGKTCGNKLTTICERLGTHCEKPNETEHKTISTTQSEYISFENTHTIILDETIYITETVYSTHTNVVLKTVDCNSKDTEDCTCTPNMAICPTPTFTLEPTKSRSKSKPTPTTSLKPTESKNKPKPSPTSSLETTESRDKLKPSLTKTPDKNISIINVKECEITTTMTIKNKFSETITMTVTVSKIPKTTDNAQIEKSHGVRIEFQKVL
ncbi:unnamed protein product, partial [Pneumocystis jirovecii]